MTVCDQNSNELILSLLLDSFDTLVVRASELTQKNSIHVIDGCNFLASQIEEYISTCGMD